MSLHELLKLERPLLVFDTETTGPNPSQDRVVELGFIQLFPDGTMREWQSFINPGMPIPKEATYGRRTPKSQLVDAAGNVTSCEFDASDNEYPGHGITDAMVQGCKTCGAGRDSEQHLAGCPDDAGAHDFDPWPTFGQLAPHLIKGFATSDVCGYNVKRFDVPLLVAEFARNGVVWDASGVLVLDGFRIWQVAEGRSLSDAVETFLGRKHVGAHRALDDVRATLEILVAQLRRFDQLPRDLRQLHEKCWPKDPNAIDPDGKILWKDGVVIMNFGSKWKGRPLTSIPPADLRWIVGPKCEGASAAVKKICDDALKGIYPQPTLKEIE